MWCALCHREVRDCVCPDIDERLARLGKSPHLALTYCQSCGRQIERCTCPIKVPARHMAGRPRG